MRALGFRALSVQACGHVAQFIMHLRLDKVQALGLVLMIYVGTWILGV